MNATSALPTDPGEGSPDAGVTRVTPSRRRRRHPRRRRGARARGTKSVYTNERDERCGEGVSGRFRGRRHRGDRGRADGTAEERDDDAERGLVRKIPQTTRRRWTRRGFRRRTRRTRRTNPTAPNAVWRWTPTLLIRSRRSRSARRLRPHVSTRGVSTTVTDPRRGTAAGSRRRARQTDAAGRVRADARKIKTMTVKGLVQEPTDISDEAKRPPDTHAPEPPEPS